jgi:hypothetical protein
MDTRSGKRWIAAYFILGALLLIGLPETARWFHGGAFAQSSSQAPPVTPPSGVGQQNNYGPGEFFNVPGQGNKFYLNPPQPTSRDPDGLYQLNQEVGSVGPANIDQANSTVTFQGVRSAGKLDPTREVEYRDFILRCEGLPMAPPANSFSGTVISMSTEAHCKIVGHR